MAYHLREISKQEYGTPFKILEETEELIDAFEQCDKILIACELSDIYGALEAVAEKEGLTMDDLKRFSDKTKSIK